MMVNNNVKNMYNKNTVCNYFQIFRLEIFRCDCGYSVAGGRNSMLCCTQEKERKTDVYPREQQ